MDARDRLAAVLFGHLERYRRITLGDAIRASEEMNLGDDDALAALERLARRTTARLQRFYVEGSGSQARIVSADAVRERAMYSPEARREWASTVEVVWATCEAEAISGGEQAC